MRPRSRKPRSVLLARKAEEQERIREIHSALGGSADAFDRAAEQPPDEEVTLGSRIDAYIKLQTAGRAAATAPLADPPDPVYEAPPLVLAEPPYEPPPLALDDPPELYEPPVVLVEEPPEPLYEPPVVLEEPPEPLYEPPVVLVEEPPEPLYEPPVVLEGPPAPLYEPPVVLEEPPVVEAPPAVEEPPAPVEEPPVQLVAMPVAPPPAPRRVREPQVKAPRGPSALSRARRAAALRVRNRASSLARAFRRSSQVLVHLVLGAVRIVPGGARLLARGVGTVLAAFAVALEHVRSGVGRAVSARRSARARPRPPKTVRSRQERRDQERLSASVLQRVQVYTPSVADDAPPVAAPEPEPEPEKAEPVAPPPPLTPPAAARDKPREARVFRRPHVRPRALLLAAALGGAATAAVLIVDRGDGGSVNVSAKQHAAAVRAMANVSTSRASFSNPGAYASAMTLLALANGKTHVSTQPSCDEKSTWKRWSCDAKGLPSVGPFAGHWVTYRCTPSYAQQPGGAPAALVVNCRPQTA
jgi:hypothetical protein